MLLLTLFGMAGWILKVPTSSFDLTECLFVIGGFAIFFFVAGIFAGRKIKTSSDQLAHIPALSAVLPFIF